MGCIKSKEDKSPAIKYRTENTPEPISAGVSQYGAEHPAVTPSSSVKGSSANFSSLSITPFGGSSGVTPFGGASSSFSVVPSSYPASLTGESQMDGDAVREWDLGSTSAAVEINILLKGFSENTWKN